MTDSVDSQRIRYQRSGLARRVRSWINPGLLRWTSGGAASNLDRALVVAGSPRSGTTWLSELLATLPGAAVLFEPLQAERVPEAWMAGFHRGTLLRPGDVDVAKQRVVERALRGEVLNEWTISRLSLMQAWRRDRWVVKFVHGNLLLNWMSSLFPIRPPAMIIRHPCAVVASQLKMWRAHCWQRAELTEFSAAWPQFKSLLADLRSPEQRLAACWCIEQFAPLADQSPEHPIQVVSYERLVRDGRRELARLLSTWQLDVPPAAYARLRIASTTTQRDSHVLQVGDPLAAWHSKLSANQVGQILEVVERFGLDFYTEALEPDYDRLHGSQPLRVDPFNSSPGAAAFGSQERPAA